MNKFINFNEPILTGNELEYISSLKSRLKFCGDGYFTKKCNSLLENITGAQKVLLTTSCTHALELAALLLDLKPGDEVIMPSYTFVSTANAFALRGAKIIFVDLNPDTMNIDETKIVEAITNRTKVIVPVHYGGVPCEMDTINSIASEYGLYVIEDAAQAINSKYKSKHLGTLGQLGALSFHETKNIHCGEGGALLINDSKFFEKAEIIREKGTNRSKFIRGQIDKYSWVDLGSSYLPSELNAAFLLAQLENIEHVTRARKELCSNYYTGLLPLAQQGKLEIQDEKMIKCHNGHLFFIKLKNISERQRMIEALKEKCISTAFHYVPLHSSNYGLLYSKFSGVDQYTTRESERLLRLPLHLNLTLTDINYITESIEQELCIR